MILQQLTKKRENKILSLLELADRNDSSGKFAKSCCDSIDNWWHREKYKELKTCNSFFVEAVVLQQLVNTMFKALIVFADRLRLKLRSLILKFISTFVFFDNAVQKVSGLHNFFLCLWSQLKMSVKRMITLSKRLSNWTRQQIQVVDNYLYLVQSPA